MNIQTHAARLALTERKLKKTDALEVLENLYAQTKEENHLGKNHLGKKSPWKKFALENHLGKNLP